MKIYVRRRHIKEGGLRSVNCPIALAFYELTGETPSVCERVIECLLKSYALPRSAQRFIARFDAGKPVKPFAFTIK